jgi:hypothetical protein
LIRTDLTLSHLFPQHCKTRQLPNGRMSEKNTTTAKRDNCQTAGCLKEELHAAEPIPCHLWRALPSSTLINPEVLQDLLIRITLHIASHCFTLLHIASHCFTLLHIASPSSPSSW